MQYTVYAFLHILVCIYILCMINDHINYVFSYIYNKIHWKITCIVSVLAAGLSMRDYINAVLVRDVLVYEGYLVCTGEEGCLVCTRDVWCVRDMRDVWCVHEGCLVCMKDVWCV